MPSPQRAARRRALPIALTGTPGTGKSSVARHLAPRRSSIEVGDLALRLGCGRRAGPRSITVDLPALATAVRADRPPEEIVVGHLAHLLPVREAIVLRCHPLELGRRLARARRGTAGERRENVAAEATDVVLFEALRPGRRVWEIDTTGLPVAAAARRVEDRLRRRGPSRFGSIDWLSDPTVTEELLRPPP